MMPHWLTVDITNLGILLGVLAVAGFFIGNIWLGGGEG